MMGQLPDNAPEEQLAVIRRFTEEHRGGGLRLINLPRLGHTPVQPPRRQASPRTTPGGPSRRGATNTNPTVPGTTLEPVIAARPVPSVSTGPAAPPTDVPLVPVRRLPPSQRPPRAARAGPPHWAIPLATSRHPVKKKKPPEVIPPPRAPGGQRRMEARTEEPGDLVTLRFRLSWSIPAVVGILLFILGLAPMGSRPTIVTTGATMWRSSLFWNLPAVMQPRPS